MKILVIAVLLVISTVLASAKVYKPADIQPVHLQDRDRYVCNPDGILSEAAVDSIDAAFRVIEDSTGVQALVAVLSEIDPDDCFEFAHQLGEKVGVGRSGSNNGLVILLCTEERCIQFATGYGIEGVLPDAICKRVQERYMNRYFAQDNWDAGMVAGAKALKEILLKGEYDDEDDSDDKAAIAGISVFVLNLQGSFYFSITHFLFSVKRPFLFRFFVHGFQKEGHRPEAVIAGKHCRSGIFHPSVVKIFASVSKCHDERRQRIPGTAAEAGRLLPPVAYKNLAYLHHAGVFNRVLILVHQVVILCDLLYCNPDLFHVSGSPSRSIFFRVSSSTVSRKAVSQSENSTASKA